ncbi:MAG: hypothetical protein DRJ37_03810 [Thermoprotei archaeon]|nr:MAG: hypothetical protein DRJ37_03810 [Thermoprotei archaeon]
MSYLDVHVEIVEVDENLFNRIPLPCRSCTYWEDPRVFDTRPPEEDRIRAKKKWYRKVLEEYGVCGKILFYKRHSVGYIEFAPPRFIERLGEYDSRWLSDSSNDRVFITCLYIISGYRRKGFGTLLLRDTLSQLKERGVREVYTYARLGSSNNPSGPLDFWLKNRFTIVDLRLSNYPLVRKII